MVWRGMDSINDGTSNTVFVSERVFFNQQKSILGGVVMDRTTAIQNQNAAGAVNVNPNNCMDTRGGKAGQYADGLTLTTSEDFGGRWYDGGPCSNLFGTIMPPNSPNCYSSANTSNDRLLGGPQSYHSGGVNVSRADGSASFISNTIDYGSITVSTLLKTTGESDFGVWGAMGSKSGGESKSL